MFTRSFLGLAAALCLTAMPAMARPLPVSNHEAPPPVTRIQTAHGTEMAFLVPTSPAPRYLAAQTYHASPFSDIRALPSVQAAPIQHLSVMLPSGVYDQQATPLVSLPLFGR